MIIAVASGKGGTGKSTIATNLAVLLAEQCEDVAIIDCDVEEPNCHIFLKPEISDVSICYEEIPNVNSEMCDGCGKCVSICRFNSLALVKNKVLVFPELCHSCGGCWLVCPTKAITRSKYELGVVELGMRGDLKVVQGKLNIGQPMAVPLIQKTIDTGSNYNLQIVDCPPGTSCSMVNSVEDADYVIMVTEPTPFGLNDLKLAVDVTRKLNKKVGLVINRSGKDDSLITDYAKNEGIDVIATIAEDLDIAKCYSKGMLVVDKLPQYKQQFVKIANHVRGLL